MFRVFLALVFFTKRMSGVCFQGMLGLNHIHQTQPVYEYVLYMYGQGHLLSCYFPVREAALHVSEEVTGAGGVSAY